MSRLSHRQFVVGAGAIGGSALLAGCGRLPWQGQPRVYRVGWLGSDRTTSWLEWFRQGMREQGYVEGQNLTLEVRTAPRPDEQRYAAATELAGLSLDVIVAEAPPWAAAARDTSPSIPIVFGLSSDPVGEGLVASFARPEGNLTGLSVMNRALSGKRVELLAQSVPSLTRLGVLRLIFPGVGSELDRDETLAAARTLGIEPLLLEAQPGPVLGSLFEAALHEHVGAVLVLPGAFGVASRISELALAAHLPTMCPQRDFVTVGCMMSYGPHYPTIFRRVAVYVDKILNGTKPADLPVEQPMLFDLVVNMKTARELGITFPNEIMLQVTEVIDQ